MRSGPSATLRSVAVIAIPVCITRAAKAPPLAALVVQDLQQVPAVPVRGGDDAGVEPGGLWSYVKGSGTASLSMSYKLLLSGMHQAVFNSLISEDLLCDITSLRARSLASIARLPTARDNLALSLSITRVVAMSGDEVELIMGKGGVSLIWCTLVWWGEYEGVVGGGAGDNTGEGGDIGSDEEGIWGSGEDHGESADDGEVDIARSLATSASDHTGVGTGARIEILDVTQYAGCGGGVAADSSVSNGLLSSSSDGARSVADNRHDPPRGPHRHPCPDPPQDRTLGHSQVTEQWVRQSFSMMLILSNNLIISMLWAWNKIGRGGASALAPHAQHVSERVGPKKRPPRMGPLASKSAQVTRDHRLLVILCLINPQMG
ncbi:hypothetical protein Tco_0790049 [Tanacetum coccineum]